MSDADMIMETDVLVAEIDRARERLNAAPIIDQKLEFVNNVYPLLKLIVQSHGIRLDQAEGALGELIQGSESLIQPDDAVRIQGTLALGLELAAAVLANADAIPDFPNVEKLTALARAYHEAAAITAQAVEEFTFYDEDEDDEPGEEVAAAPPIEIPDGVESVDLTGGSLDQSELGSVGIVDANEEPSA